LGVANVDELGQLQFVHEHFNHYVALRCRVDRRQLFHGEAIHKSQPGERRCCRLRYLGGQLSGFRRLASADFCRHFFVGLAGVLINHLAINQRIARAEGGSAFRQIKVAIDFRNHGRTVFGE